MWGGNKREREGEEEGGCDRFVVSYFLATPQQQPQQNQDIVMGE